MGRSVWTHSNAVETVFREINNCHDYCAECDVGVDGYECPKCGTSMYDESGDTARYEFNDLVGDIRDLFKQQFPSMHDCDHWPERESHAIVENDHCMVVISEYCGLVSIGVVPTGYEGYYSPITTGIAANWAERFAAPYLRKQFGKLEKVGTMSNGESVYERIT
jgi:hypothetical protein